MRDKAPHGICVLFVWYALHINKITHRNKNKSIVSARWDKLRAQYVKAIEDQDYSIILMSVRNWFPGEMAGSYRQAVDLFPGDDANSSFRPVAGKPPYRPRWIYQPMKATGQE